MKIKKAFTLIEMSAVIVILLILIGISLPLLNKSGSAHEVKLSANAIYSLLSLCDSMSRASGKVYMADLNVNFSLPSLTDPTDLNGTSPKKFYRFNVIQIYCSSWDAANNVVKNIPVGESYELPYTLIALYDVQTSTESDKIYFKPDGEYEPNNKHIYVYPDKKPQIFYQISLLNMKITSYKD
jgi:prepilin-type N-terminal cleavage/methylation domain-containing protein